MRVCIDPGHGGSDPGAIGVRPFELREKDFNLAVALLLEEQLVDRGFEAVLTRRQDRTLSLSARAGFANRHGAGLFLSIHANAAAAPSAEGMEVFHFPESSAGKALAKPILKNLLAAFPDHRNRGVKEANFTVLRLTHMPAALVECEFLSSPKQLRFLAKAGNQRGIAQAIADALLPPVVTRLRFAARTRRSHD